jgi:shikimate dehydrogenase
MIIGHPLTHTLTPTLHNIVYKKMDLNAVMLAHNTLDLASTLSALKTLSVGLIAVTMPYKEALIPYLDEMSDEVKALRATNTVVCHNGKLSGENTDIDGISYALRDCVLTNKNVLLIGGGGAAKASAYYLERARANLFYLNRRDVQSQALMGLFGGNKVTHNEINDLPIDIIINATPQGMYPNNNTSPLTSYKFHSHQVVFDMVYDPENTALIKDAKVQGARFISGLDMFLAQGLKQIELYANKTINIKQLVPIIKNELKCLHALNEEEQS